jgi:hypothetical protein
MDTKDILVIIAPVVVAFGVSFYNYHTGRKSRREDAAFKFKEEDTQKFLISFILRMLPNPDLQRQRKVFFPNFMKHGFTLPMK